MTRDHTFSTLYDRAVYEVTRPYVLFLLGKKGNKIVFVKIADFSIFLGNYSQNSSYSIEKTVLYEFSKMALDSVDFSQSFFAFWD